MIKLKADIMYMEEEIENILSNISVNTNTDALIIKYIDTLSELLEKINK
jgi:hypothetical protein